MKRPKQLQRPTPAQGRALNAIAESLAYVTILDGTRGSLLRLGWVEEREGTTHGIGLTTRGRFALRHYRGDQGIRAVQGRTLYARLDAARRKKAAIHLSAQDVAQLCQDVLVELMAEEEREIAARGCDHEWHAGHALGLRRSVTECPNCGAKE